MLGELSNHPNGSPLKEMSVHRWQQVLNTDKIDNDKKRVIFRYGSHTHRYSYIDFIARHNCPLFLLFPLDTLAASHMVSISTPFLPNQSTLHTRMSTHGISPGDFKRIHSYKEISIGTSKRSLNFLSFLSFNRPLAPERSFLLLESGLYSSLKRRCIRACWFLWPANTKELVPIPRSAVCVCVCVCNSV